MKVWISKYALTKGIFSLDDAEVCVDINLRMLKVKWNGYNTYFHGEEWHSTEAGARLKAETMRIKKIKSLQKSIKKIEELKF